MLPVVVGEFEETDKPPEPTVADDDAKTVLSLPDLIRHIVRHVLNALVVVAPFG